MRTSAEVRTAVLVSAALGALLLTGSAAHAQVAQKAPAAQTVTTSEQRLVPGETKTFFVICPDGYILTDTNIHAVTVGGSERPDPKAAGLKVSREANDLDSMIVDIGNSGSETLRVFVYARCIRKSVRVRVGRASVKAGLKDNGVVRGGAAGGGTQRSDCGKGRLAIGQDLSELSAFSPLSFLASVVLFRRYVRWTLGRLAPPPTAAEVLDEYSLRIICTARRARVGAAGGPKKLSAHAAARASARAGVIIRRIGRNRVIPPHANSDQTKRISVRCPRRFTATSFGWDGRNPDLNQLSVQLRRSLYPGRRRVAVEVTNTSGAERTVRLTAICLSFRVKA
jgi:hypothetical protein